MDQGRIRIALIGLLVAACGTGPAPSAPIGDLQTASIERDGVRVSLALEGPPRSGARSWADALVENLGPKAVRWAGGGCDDPVTIGIDLRAAFARGRDWPGLLGRFKALALGGGGFENPALGGYEEQSRIQEPGQMPLLCTADLRINELPAGASLTMRAGWDGTIGGVAPAPAGPAAITASFPFIGISGVVPPDLTDRRPIVARIDTAVEAGQAAPPMPPAVAVDAALADPQFAAWVEAGPEATWINPHLLYADGVWAVGLFRFGPGGRSELFGEVKVDGSGTVVGRRFEH